MENPNVLNEDHPIQLLSQSPLPNSTAVLVLGILSILGCFCYGLTGIVLGIIAIILATRAKKLYDQNPILYTQASLKNLNAGKVCAIVGLSLSALYILFLVIYLVVFGSALFGIFNGMM